MKTPATFILLIATAALAFAAEKITAGPMGGRLLDTAPLKAEFFVTKDRKVEVAFYDACLLYTSPSPRDS